MKDHWKTRMTALSIACALALGTPLSAGSGMVQAAQETEKPADQETIAQIPSIGSVSIGGGSTLELKEAAVTTGDDGKYVFFTVTLNNAGGNEIQFIDYWVRLQSKGGTRYSVQFMPGNKDKNRVPAGSSLDVQMYAKIGEETALDDLVFRFIRWDFSLPHLNYERTLGEITVPKDYSAVIPAGAKRLLAVSGTQLKTAVSDWIRNQSDEYYFVSVSLEMENVGFKSAVLPPYVYAIETSEGYWYPLEVRTDSGQQQSLAPRIVKKWNLTAAIPRAVSPDDWKLVILLPEQSLNVEMPVAAFALPAPASVEAPEGGASWPLDVSGTTVLARLKDTKLDAGSETSVVHMTLRLENQGTKAVKVPNYRLMLKTADGLEYPLTAPELEQLSINPKTSREIGLEAELPADVESDGLTLELLQPAGDGTDERFDYPAAVLVVPKPAEKPDTVPSGIDFRFEGESGNYAAKLTAIQRLPYEDDDVLTAKVVITNTDDAAQPVPELTGHFLIDGRVKLEAEAVYANNPFNLAKGEQATLYLVAKVPYKARFTKANVVLHERESEQKAREIAEFSHAGNLRTMPVLERGEQYRIDAAGKSAGARLLAVHTYKGADSDLFYAELELENLETRFSQPGQLIGYVQLAEGVYFPADISSVSRRVGPNGKAMVVVSALLPKNFNMGDLRLLVGTELTAGTETAYVNPVLMELPVEFSQVATSFNELSVYPYTVSLDNFAVRLNAGHVDSFSFSFDYELEKQAGIVYTPEKPHRLVLELTDSNQRFEASFDLEQGTNPMEIGKGSLSFTGTNTELVYKMSTARSFVLKVYAEYDGHRKLLAQQSYDWFNLIKY